MIDFKAELARLIEQEKEPLPSGDYAIENIEFTGLTEIAKAVRQQLVSFDKKQTDLSLQIEEIYDLTQDSDCSAINDALREEKSQGNCFKAAIIGLCDILEDFCAYTHISDTVTDEHESKHKCECECEYGDKSEYEGEYFNAQLKNQARLMWKNAGVLLEGCGITRLGEVGQVLDPQIHSVSAAVFSTIPQEHVAAVLQCGYRCLGEVMRKATVVISAGPAPEFEGEAVSESEDPV